MVTENISLLNANVKGFAKIELFNKDNNLVKSTQGNNVISLGLKEQAQAMYRGLFMQYTNSSPGGAIVLQKDFNTFLRLYNIDKTKESGLDIVAGLVPVMPMYSDQPDNELKGWVDKDTQTIGSDIKQGLLNTHDSYITKEKAVFVYDWTSSNANGTFNTIVHSTDDADEPRDTHSFPISSSKAIPIIDDTEKCICADSTNYYRLKSKNEVEIWNRETREYNLLTFPEGIEFSWWNINYAFVVWTVGDYTYYCHADSSAIVKHNNITDEWANMTLVGISHRAYSVLSIDDTYLYASYRDYVRRFNLSDFTFVDETDISGFTYIVYYNGNFYDSKNSRYVSANEIEYGLTGTGANADHIKTHKAGYTYSRISDDNGQYHGANPECWFFMVRDAWKVSSSDTNSRILHEKAKKSDGSLAYHRRETAVWHTDNPITKSANESMRITYTFDFE